MSEKVMLTPKQAGAIEHALTNESSLSKDRPDNLLDLFAHNKWSNGGFTGRLSAINDLSISELAQALYVGYEIKQEFVSFEEAMKALRERKKVKFHYGEEIYNLNKYALSDPFDSYVITKFSLSVLFQDKWTIEDDTP